MTVTVANVLTTSTFDYQRNRINELADAMTTKAVTVNSNSAVGNAYITGIVGGNTLVATTIRGGNVGTSDVLIIGSNVTVGSGNTLSIGNATVNVAITQTAISISGVSILPVLYGISTTTSGTSAQLTDSFVFASFTGADYVLKIKDTGANSIQVAKALVVCDGGDAYLSEFGVVTSNADLGSFSANANATHVRVYFTPTVSATEIKGQRQILYA
jgi:hypothetical protein